MALALLTLFFVVLCLVSGCCSGVLYYRDVARFLNGGNAVYDKCTAAAQPARIYGSNVYTTAAECRRRLAQCASAFPPHALQVAHPVPPARKCTWPPPPLGRLGRFTPLMRKRFSGTLFSTADFSVVKSFRRARAACLQGRR